MAYDLKNLTGNGLSMNTQAQAETIRLQFIDAAKTVGNISGDCLPHRDNTRESHRTPRPGNSLLSIFLHGMAAIAVPLFFVINGYLVLNRTVLLRDHLIKTLRLYALTLIWSLIIIVCLVSIDGAGTRPLNLPGQCFC